MPLDSFEGRWAIKKPLFCVWTPHIISSFKASSQPATCSWNTLLPSGQGLLPQLLRYLLKCPFLSVASLATVYKITPFLCHFRQPLSFLPVFRGPHCYLSHHILHLVLFSSHFSCLHYRVNIMIAGILVCFVHCCIHTHIRRGAKT